MDNEADIAVGVDRVDQERRIGQQILVVGPIAKNGDGQLVVAALPFVAVIGERRMLN